MFTDLEMRQKPQGRDKWLSTSFGRGKGSLLGRITPAGARLFYFAYQGPNDKRDKVEIGRYDPEGRTGLTLRQALDKGRELSDLYIQHRDLRKYFERLRHESEEIEHKRLAELERQRHEAVEAARQAELERQRRLTVRQLFVRWADTELCARIGTNGKRIGRKDSGRFAREQFERHVFPEIGEMAAADLRRADLMRIFDEHVARGAVRTAGVLFADLKQMLRFAVLREIIPYSPLADLRIGDVGGSKGVERDRVLCATEGKPDEIRLLSERLPSARLHPRYEAAVWILLSTLCRVGELLQARWEDVDLERRLWRIPEENAKNDRQHLVHLSDFALRQFHALLAVREIGSDGAPTPWLFPSRSGKDHVCVKTFGKQLADRQRGTGDRMANRSKATDALCLPGGRWTPHDLRRTGATIMAELGISNDVIDACLNHIIEKRVTRTYIVSRRWEDQARAFDAIGRRLDVVAFGAAEESKVVTLRA